MFRYQDKPRFFAQIPEDMKDLGLAELEELGAHKIESSYRGFYFDADQETLYRIIYTTRLFNRILAPLHRFDAHSTDDLYRRAKNMEWEKILSPDMTFAIFANVANSKIKHSKFASLRLKDAIADRMVDVYGERSSIDTHDPDVWINLFVNKNKAVVNIDLSGGSLHKRGYRVESTEAPLQEILAAAFVRHSGWDGETPLYDYMCGSGTIVLEAMMKYCRIPAAYLRRHFGFEECPDFAPEIWEKVKSEADAKIRPLPEGLIHASDICPDAIAAFKANASQLPGFENIDVKVCDFNDIEEIHDATIITNPPYGIRLKNDEDMAGFIHDMGDFLKQNCSGSNAYIYFGERKLITKVGLRASSKTPFNNGGLDGRLIKLELYRGSRH